MMIKNFISFNGEMLDALQIRALTSEEDNTRIFACASVCVCTTRLARGEQQVEFPNVTRDIILYIFAALFDLSCPDV